MLPEIIINICFVSSSVIMVLMILAGLYQLPKAIFEKEEFNESYNNDVENLGTEFVVRLAKTISVFYFIVFFVFLTTSYANIENPPIHYIWLSFLTLILTFFRSIVSFLKARKDIENKIRIKRVREAFFTIFQTVYFITTIALILN